MGLCVNIRKSVNGFSLYVRWEMDNEVCVLFGYSGAGKSLTLQLIAGLMNPDWGSVRLGDKIFFDASEEINMPPQARSIGYVFQDPVLFPHMTVRENIRFGGKGLERPEIERRHREVIEKFCLQGLEESLPSEISGGQKQRVALARALLRRPDILLLDEPFSALDNPIRLEMRRLLRDIKNEFAIPVVLVTHDIFEAYTMADKLIVYSEGRVVQTGRPSEILTKPINHEVRTLVECSWMAPILL